MSEKSEDVAHVWAGDGPLLTKTISVTMPQGKWDALRSKYAFEGRLNEAFFRAIYDVTNQAQAMKIDDDGPTADGRLVAISHLQIEISGRAPR